MARLKCNKCGNVFEKNYRPFDSMVRLGPYRRYQCPACGKSSFFNVLSSVNDPITWPPQEKRQEQQTAEPKLTEEEQEKKRIEESKYEKA
jgi:predicted  nucleic acid-binding Zn-ribbon protein